MSLRLAAIVSILTCAAAFPQDTRYPPEGSQIPGPAKDDFDAWLRDLKTWRHERLTRMGYDDAEYRRPEFQWAQRDFIQPQTMVEERYFYDPVHAPLYCDALPGRSRQTLRRHRQRADLAGLSEHRHRQPQPVGSPARSARRHPRPSRDDRGLPPPGRARASSRPCPGTTARAIRACLTGMPRRS